MSVGTVRRGRNCTSQPYAVAVLGDEARNQSHRLLDGFWNCDINVSTKPARQLGRATPADLEWNSDRPLDISSLRRARRYARAHDTASTRRWTSRSLLTRWEFRRLSYQLVMCATEATSNIIFRIAGGTKMNEISGIQIEFESAGGLCRLRADSSVKMKPGTDGAKMFMGVEQDHAEFR